MTGSQIITYKESILSHLYRKQWQNIHTYTVHYHYYYEMWLKQEESIGEGGGGIPNTYKILKSILHSIVIHTCNLLWTKSESGYTSQPQEQNNQQHHNLRKLVHVHIHCT